MTNEDTLLTDLQAFFSATPIPAGYVFSPGQFILSPERFLESHFSLVQAGWGKPWARPYLSRLLKIREQLSGGSGNFGDANSGRTDLERL